jgi:hypothetical protein
VGGVNNRKTIALVVSLLCATAAVLAIVILGGDDEPSSAGAAATRPVASAPLELTLEPAHHSGVTGTATLVPDGANLNVTLKLSKHGADRLMAHIHTGPCSNEPTASNPRIWANLTDVIKGTSKTVVNVVTLKELQSESSSINVHDPAHNLRPLVCADIPRAG